ncbi:MAG: hypothetical protein SGPRY_011488 [Prymnesium sp.]
MTPYRPLDLRSGLHEGEASKLRSSGLLVGEHSQPALPSRREPHAHRATEILPAPITSDASRPAEARRGVGIDLNSNQILSPKSPPQSRARSEEAGAQHDSGDDPWDAFIKPTPSMPASPNGLVASSLADSSRQRKEGMANRVSSFKSTPSMAASPDGSIPASLAMSAT